MPHPTSSCTTCVPPFTWCHTPPRPALRVPPLQERIGHRRPRTPSMLAYHPFPLTPRVPRVLTQFRTVFTVFTVLTPFVSLVEGHYYLLPPLLLTTVAHCYSLLLQQRHVSLLTIFSRIYIKFCGRSNSFLAKLKDFPRNVYTIS